MRKAITAFVRYPFYAQALVFLTLVFGIAALFSIRKASFPITESRLITVSVTYQGATPKEMEEGVTTLVENGVGCSLDENRGMYLGFFLAPQIVESAVKTSVFACAFF